MISWNSVTMHSDFTILVNLISPMDVPQTLEFLDLIRIRGSGHRYSYRIRRTIAWITPNEGSETNRERVYMHYSVTNLFISKIILHSTHTNDIFMHVIALYCFLFALLLMPTLEIKITYIILCCQNTHTQIM